MLTFDPILAVATPTLMERVIPFSYISNHGLRVAALVPPGLSPSFRWFRWSR